MRRVFRRLILLLGTLVLLGAGGCGKKEPVVVSMFCNSSHLPAAEELARTFSRVYNVGVVCIPIDEDVPLRSDPPRGRRIETSAKTAAGESEKMESDAEPEGSLYFESKIRRWVAESSLRDFSQYLLDHKIGDLYLCDSPEESRLLMDEKLVVRERKVAYLFPVLLTAPGNPHGFYALRDVLESGRSLGILRAEVGGLGRETDRLLQSIEKVYPGIAEKGKIVEFSSITMLLNALEKGEIEAAISWEHDARRIGNNAERIPITGRNDPAIPLVVLTFSNASNYQRADLFSVFFASERAENVLSESGYRTR